MLGGMGTNKMTDYGEERGSNQMTDWGGGRGRNHIG